MSANEQVAEGKGLTDFSVDPNVRVPEHVKAAAAAAEAIHQHAYAPPETTAEEKAAQEAEAAEAVRAAEAEAAATRAQQPSQEVNPQVQSPPLQPEHHPDTFNQPADPQSLKDSEWARRYNSMYGRNQQLQRTVGSMQQQMQELGEEVVRLQQLLTTPAQNSHAQDHAKLITDQDRETYGDDLIDVVRRGAQEVLGPEIDALKAENQHLKKQVTTQAQKDVRADLAHEVPDWIAINRSPQFKAWLALPNIYTGQARGQMLKAAYQAADAPRVVAIFKDFVMEVAATGQTLQTPQAEQRALQEQPPIPRQAAVSLETLAAPGRAKPASGDSQVPADKPFITRSQISKFYDDKRRGHYAGREAQAAQFEADLTVAQREGRVRG